MNREEIYRKFRESRQERLRLSLAMDGFLSDPEGDGKDVQEYRNYLKKRIRPAMEALIEREETEKMERLERQGWFGEKELEGFLALAREKGKTASLLWLMLLKDQKYGYHDKDFSL